MGGVDGAEITITCLVISTICRRGVCGNEGSDEPAGAQRESHLTLQGGISASLTGVCAGPYGAAAGAGAGAQKRLRCADCLQSSETSAHPPSTERHTLEA